MHYKDKATLLGLTLIQADEVNDDMRVKGHYVNEAQRLLDQLQDKINKIRESAPTAFQVLNVVLTKPVEDMTIAERDRQNKKFTDAQRRSETFGHPVSVSN